MDNPFSFETQEASVDFNSNALGVDTYKVAFDSVSTLRFIYGIVRQFLAYFKVFEGTKIAPIARLIGTGAEFLFGAIFTLVKPNTSIKEKLIAIAKVFAITLGFAVGGLLTLFLGPLAPYIAGGIFAVSTLVELGICAYDLHKTRIELKKEKANLHSLKELLREKKTEPNRAASITAEIGNISDKSGNPKSTLRNLTIAQIKERISNSELKIANLTTKRHQQGLAIVGCVLSTIAATVAFAAVFAFPPIGIVLTAVALGFGVTATSCFVAKKIWELVTNFRNKTPSVQEQSYLTNKPVQENKGFFHTARKLLAGIFVKKEMVEERQHLIPESSISDEKEKSASGNEIPIDTGIHLKFSTANILAAVNQDPSPGNSPHQSRELSQSEATTSSVTQEVFGALYLNQGQSTHTSHNSACSADARQEQSSLPTVLPIHVQHVH